MLLDNPQKILKYNLFAEYADVFPSSDLLLILATALGGSGVPVDLFTSSRIPKRQWTPDGEIETITATEYGLHPTLATILSDETSITQTSQLQDIVESKLEDETPAWSIRPESQQSLHAALSPETQEFLADQTLRLLCYACPPYYEGKVNWYAAMPLTTCFLLTPLEDFGQEKGHVDIARSSHSLETAPSVNQNAMYRGAVVFLRKRWFRNPSSCFRSRQTTATQVNAMASPCLGDPL